MLTFEIEYSGRMYWETWGVFRHPEFGLVAMRDENQAQLEQTGKKQNFPLVAIVQVGHTAYNIVGAGHLNNVASRVIEEASARLGIEYSDDPNAPLLPPEARG